MVSKCVTIHYVATKTSTIECDKARCCSSFNEALQNANVQFFISFFRTKLESIHSFETGHVLKFIDLLPSTCVSSFLSAFHGIRHYSLLSPSSSLSSPNVHIFKLPEIFYQCFAAKIMLSCAKK